MGEVYLGEDTRLGRKVAIKVLPEQFASDPARLARFEQESRAAAALNHPHIAVVHDVGKEQADGEGPTVHFMVQEYLEGDTLGATLVQGALPLKKALGLATEMAEALAAAHGSNIVHRDLKPANVFVTPEGHAKVLDFGLAKLVEPEELGGGTETSRSPTMLGTVAGQVMGTAGYMAPEQIAAEEIDNRADVFAFGCVLYEMATGKKAFTGASVLDTLHAIVHDEPQPPGQINPSLPAELQRILKKCLAKQRTDRYRSAGDLAADLRALAAEVEAGTAVPLGAASEVVDGAVGRLPNGRRISAAVAAAAIIVVGLAAGVAGWLMRPSPPAEERSMSLFEIELGAGAVPFGGRSVAISPDGRYIAWTGFVAEPGALAPMLYIRRMNQAGIVSIPGTELAQYPFFSPDSQWVGFATFPYQGEPGRLMKVSIDGGDPFELCECRGVATWADDDNIYLALAGGAELVRLPSEGGDPEPVAEAPEGSAFFRPTALPGSNALLIEVESAAEGRRIATLALSDARPKEIIADGSDPRYSRSGHIIYGRGDALFAVGFDPERLEVTSPPTPIIQDVRVTETGMIPVAISNNGTLAYVPGAFAGLGEQYALVWVDRSGGRQLVTERRGAFRAARLSPDGRQIALEVAGERTAIWILGIEDDSFAPLNNEGNSAAPLWTPDSRTVLFNWDEVERTSVGSTFGGIYARDAGFGSERREILETDGSTYPLSWSGDGEDLVLHEMIEGEQRRRILVMPFAGEDRTPFAPLDPSGQFNQRSPMVSPDGRWVAYVSTQSGRDEVYARPFPDGGTRVQVSNNGGVEPMWGANSSELFYREFSNRVTSTMISAQLSTDPELHVTRRADLFTGPYYFMVNWARTVYDYDRANDRFLMVDMTGNFEDSENALKITVLLDWFGEIRQRLPGGQ
jgi:serine/threonine-protein kinase